MILAGHQLDFFMMALGSISIVYQTCQTSVVNACMCALDMILAGLESAIFGSEDQRLIH